MRWTTQNYGECRTRTFFALFPVTTDEDNNSNYRWLEIVTIKQCYKIYGWTNIKFIDKEK